MIDHTMPTAAEADWECLECGYDRAESKGLPKPSVCPICAGDTGRDGRLVYKASPPPTAALAKPRVGAREGRTMMSTRSDAVVAEILAERRRQVEAEGWTAEHDNEHYRGELSRAAVCYALYSSCHWVDVLGKGGVNETVERYWPWDTAWWKPKDPRRDLIRAAALIVAEIERLDRAKRP